MIEASNAESKWIQMFGALGNIFQIIKPIPLYLSESVPPLLQWKSYKDNCYSSPDVIS